MDKQILQTLQSIESAIRTKAEPEYSIADLFDIEQKLDEVIAELREIKELIIKNS